MCAPVIVLTAMLLACRGETAIARGNGAVSTQQGWRSPIVSLRLVERDGAGFTAADLRAAALEAIGAWNRVPCALPKLSLDGLVKAGSARRDGVSTLSVRAEVWCSDGDPRQSCYDPDHLAFTTLHREGKGPNATIVEADVEINAVHHRWARLRDDHDPRWRDHFDLASAFAHELGHVLGLRDLCGDHTTGGVAACLSAPSKLRRATMYPVGAPGQTERRTLENADTEAACLIYGNSRG